MQSIANSNSKIAMGLIKFELTFIQTLGHTGLLTIEFG